MANRGPGVGARWWWRTAAYWLATVMTAVGHVAAAVKADGFPAVPLVALVLTVAAMPAIYVREKRPTLFLAIALGTALLGDGLLLFLAMGAFAARRRDKALVFAVVASLLALLVPALKDGTGTVVVTAGNGHELGRYAAQWIVNGILMGLAVALGAWVGTWRELVSSLKERAERAESERAMREREAVLTERTRIAREMHDVLGHKLALMSMQAGALEVNAPDRATEDSAARIRVSAKAALDELRGVVAALHEGPDEAPRDPDHGLRELPALIEHCERAGARIDYTDSITTSSEAAQIDPAVGRAAYRITQEALTNALKHSPGEEIGVCIGGAPGHGLSLTVTNREKTSGTPARGNGIGLRSVAERARVVGGTLTAGPAQGVFRVAARLPWRTTEGEEP